MRSSDRPASLARRVLPALALTGISGALLAQLDQPESAGSIAIGVGNTTRPTLATVPPPATTAATTPLATNPPGDGTTSTPPSTRPTTSSVPATPTCSGTSYTGPSVDTRWGPVQVQAVVSKAGAVCSATATGPNDRRRSIFINEQALPIINEEVVTQGANFDSVSGATVTSNGYRQSLQALLASAKS